MARAGTIRVALPNSSAKASRMVRHDRERRSGTCGVPLRVVTVDTDCSGRWRENGRDHFDERGFASSVRPQQAEELAGSDVETDVTDGHDSRPLCRERAVATTE